METTWKLRPGLTWHDGQPLTAEDFGFALQVYKAPELGGFFAPRPQDIVERLVAVDPRTIRIDWRSQFLHLGDGLEPLPRARLAESFAAFEQDPIGQRDAFTALRFWTTEYVGVGPFRLTNWTPGAQIEGAAFDGHALGRPKIDRIVIRFINDENAVLANMLAWQGSNRGAWSSPDYDLQWERYNRTLDRGEQIQAFVQAMRVHSEQLPAVALHYSLNAVTHLAALKGPEGDSGHWNIHEWELA